MKQIRILIVDDHEVVRLGLAAMFKYQKDLKVVGMADNGASAVAAAARLQPDVVVMDLMMPGTDVVDATVRMRAESPASRILVLTSFGTSADLARVLDAGASGVVLKGDPAEDLMTAIRAVADGKSVLSPEIDAFLREVPPPPNFTTRQLEILESVTRGLSNPDIAKQLGISTDAVKQHLNAIYQKLDVSTRTEAITAALRRQLLKI